MSGGSRLANDGGGGGSKRKRSGDLPDQEEDLPDEEEDHFNCCICHSTPQVGNGERLLQCDEGHWFCAGCIEEWMKTNPKCPSCRLALRVPLARALAKEQEIARILINCRHCGSACTRGDVRNHEMQCPRRVVECAAPGCNWRGMQDTFEAHTATCLHVIIQNEIVPLRQLVESQREALAASDAERLRMTKFISAPYDACCAAARAFIPAASEGAQMGLRLQELLDGCFKLEGFRMTWAEIHARAIPRSALSMTNGSLTTLILAWNDIGAEGGQAIA
eukprot:CAMPEP_0170138288 /NCGR_PEP_ID=MMETSP0033_2-20121228/4810_1 /TAXON_ID=195969 /ORGANISM="Dolichomastix tenuilepis, Strain CCMP3274" /LENGTH=276 /DNA_ID=CAMNT_0010374279 /DNA_START=343 /DNA_END=1170 /DNA_ORIENTATION=+